MGQAGTNVDDHERWRRAVIALALAALVVRGGIMIARPEGLAADPDGYRAYAESLLTHGNFLRDGRPSAWRPPLYPLVLAGGLATGAPTSWVIGALHLAMGVATVMFTALVTRDLLHLSKCPPVVARRGALGAALFVLFDPILLYESTAVMTETLATLLAVAALSSLVRLATRVTAQNAAMAGCLIGLAILCRPTFLPWGVFVAFVMVARALWNWRSRGSAAALLVYAVSALVVVAPWMLRNRQQLGRPIATTTHGGYTLLLGNNPDFYRHVRRAPWGAVWDSTQFVDGWRSELRHRRIENEIAEDRLAADLAWQNMRREPRDCVSASFVRIGRLWSPLPHRRAESESGVAALVRYAIAAWYVVEFLLSALALAEVFKRFWWRLAPAGDTAPSGGSAQTIGAVVERETGAAQRDRGLFELVSWSGTLLVALTAVHTLYWSDLRMRAPAMPVIAILALYGAVRLAREFSGPRQAVPRA